MQPKCARDAGLVIRCALILCLLCVAVPIASWAEEAAEGVRAQEQTDAADVETVPTVTDSGGDDRVDDKTEVVQDEPAATVAPAPPSAEIKAPEGYEVITIMGRAVSGIETDVPDSVTQFDAESIAALGAGNIADLAKVTPNVEIRVAGATAATFFIRGVGLSDFSANAAGAVAIYQDDVVMNTPAIQLGQLFDLRTVDIRRGPAAIGSHRNASAGAIKLYSNKPTAEYEARIRQSFGSFWSPKARDAFIRDTEGFVNLPLIEETMAMRVAFRIRKQDPYMTNGCANAPPLDRNRVIATLFPVPQPGADPASICGDSFIRNKFVSAVPEGLPKHVGDKGDWAGRAALRLSPPGTDMDWLVNFHGSRLNQSSTLGQSMGVGDNINVLGETNGKGYWEPDVKAEYDELRLDIAGVDTETEFILLPPERRLVVQREAFQRLSTNLANRPLDREPYRGDFNRVGKTTLDIWGGHLRGDFSLGRIDVTTLTGFEIYERFRDADRDFTPDSIFEAISRDEAKQFTQDFNFSGRLFDSAVRWNLGGSYLGERVKANQLSFVVTNGAQSEFPITGLKTDEINNIFSQNTTAFMTYGDVTWDFLEDFTVELGARFNSEKKDFFIQIIESARDYFGAEPPNRHETGRWNKPTGQISLSYHLTDSVTFHAKFTHGYKAGHFNTNSIKDNIEARPEFIDAFEWSANVNALEGRIIGRFGFFYYKYKDYQVFIFIDRPDNSIPNLVIVNANRVQQYGAEVDLTLKPLQGWVPEPYDQLTLDSHFGWLASQFLDFTNIDFRQAGEFGGLLAVVTEYSGNRLINSPDFKVNGTVSWPFDFGEWGKITPRYDVTWVADTYFDAAEGRGTPDINPRSKVLTTRLPQYTLAQRAYWIHNVRLTYQTPLANVEISAWVRNIKDTRYKTYAFDVSLFAKTVINFVGDPRSVGADIQITW